MRARGEILLLPLVLSLRAKLTRSDRTRLVRLRQHCVHPLYAPYCKKLNEGGATMPDYKEMYFTIIRAANKALKLNQEAMEYIITAQQQAENMYIEADDTPLFISPNPDK